MAGGDDDIKVFPCLLFACLGGLATSASNNVISYVQNRCRCDGRCCSALLVAANIVLNLLGIACFLCAAGFGPVAVVMPILTACKLLSSMCFQLAMGLSVYSKDKRVGTVVLSLSALCLIEVGPTDPVADPDVVALLTEPVAAAFLLAMGLVLLVALRTYHCGGGEKKESGREMDMVLLSAVVAVSTALAASVGKMLSITEGAMLALGVACYVGLGVLSFLYAALAAFACDMSVFMPVSECLQLLVNCATGLFIWGDAGRVRGKLSYAMVYLLICTGVYLCSSYDVFAHWQESDVAYSVPSRKLAESFGSFAITRGGSWPRSSVEIVHGKFRRQLRILKDALDAARDRETVCCHLQEEIVLWARHGFVSRTDVKELSEMLHAAADRASKAAEEVMDLRKFSQESAQHSPLLHAATVAVSDLQGA